jgi:uncharacterized BrkB/YihY/UPF0761 family membrane protein
MAIAIGALAGLVCVLLLLRQTPIYLYIWLPLVANLIGWVGLCGLAWLEFRAEHARTVGHGTGEPSIADILPLSVPVVCLLVMAIATIAVYPRQEAWKDEAVFISLFIAAVVFICPLICIYIAYRAFLLG